MSRDRAANAPGPADPPAVSAVAVLWVGSEKSMDRGALRASRKAAGDGRPREVKFPRPWHRLRDRGGGARRRAGAADASVDHTSITPKHATTSLAASVDHTSDDTDARREARRCFGRSDRSAQGCRPCSRALGHDEDVLPGSKARGPQPVPAPGTVSISPDPPDLPCTASPTRLRGLCVQGTPHQLPPDIPSRERPSMRPATGEGPGGWPGFRWRS